MRRCRKKAEMACQAFEKYAEMPSAAGSTPEKFVDSLDALVLFSSIATRNFWICTVLQGRCPLQSLEDRAHIQIGILAGDVLPAVRADH